MIVISPIIMHSTLKLRSNKMPTIKVTNDAEIHSIKDEKQATIFEITKKLTKKKRLKFYLLVV